MIIKTDVRSAGALLDQFYEKRRLLVVSTPDNSNQHYKLQNDLLQVHQMIPNQLKQKDHK